MMSANFPVLIEPFLPVSLATARGGGDAARSPAFQYLGGPNAKVLPVPMTNIVNVKDNLACGTVTVCRATRGADWCYAFPAACKLPADWLDEAGTADRS